MSSNRLHSIQLNLSLLSLEGASRVIDWGHAVKKRTLDVLAASTVV